MTHLIGSDKKEQKVKKGASSSSELAEDQSDILQNIL